MKDKLIDLLVMVLLVFSPIKASLIVVALMTGVDLVCGLLAARARKEEITSTGLRRTLSKLAVYEITIALAFLTEQYLAGELVPLVKILSGFVGITELKSVLENLQDITGVPVIQSLIDKLSNSTKDGE